MEFIKVSLLQQDTTNPRITTEEQKEVYRNLFSKFGIYVPIFVSHNNKVIFDNAKLEVARELGIEELPCAKIDNLTEQQYKAIQIAEVRAIELGKWNELLLLEELEKLGEEFANMIHFSFDDIRAKIEEEMENLEEIQEVEIPEIEEKYFSQKGDIYLLGEHRLMCGDSTNPEDVATLMNGEKAQLMVTDPPYNIDYESESGMRIENDNMGKEEFHDFLFRFYLNAKENLEEGAAFYVFYAESEAISFRAALDKAGLKYSQNLIWVKNSFNLSRQDYNWKHEPCLYGWKLGKAHYFINDYTQDTELKLPEELKGMGKKELIQYIQELEEKVRTSVIKENKPQKNDVHPTMKPIKLLTRLIVNSSQKNWKVLDLFGGSGSTLIASDQLNRKAFLMEFDEKYADVIVKRYRSTGKEDITLLRGDKQYSWDEIKEHFE